MITISMYDIRCTMYAGLRIIRFVIMGNIVHRTSDILCNYRLINQQLFYNYSHLIFLGYNRFVTLNFIYIFIILLTNSFMQTPTNLGYRTVSNHDFAVRRQKITNGQNALFALRSYQPGDVISDFSAGTISAEPTYLT